MSSEKILEKCRGDSDVNHDGIWYYDQRNIDPILLALLTDRDRLREAIKSALYNQEQDLNCDCCMNNRTLFMNLKDEDAASAETDKKLTGGEG